MKKVLGILFVVVFLCIGFTNPVSAENSDFSFGIEFTLKDSELTYATMWWQPQENDGDVYYLSLPYQVSQDALVAVLNDGVSVSVNGQMVMDNDLITEIRFGEENILVYDSKTYVFVPLLGSDIPQIFVTTDKPLGLVNKEESTSGTITIVNEDGSFEYDGGLDTIKGRGNSTWTLYPKKPFNIKLEEKANLFGLGKSKKFSLLANYIDPTLVKNKIVCDLADWVGIDFSSKSQIVDLYMDGQYFGNYTLIERVEVAENRVDITSLEELNEEVNNDVAPEDASLGGDRSEDSGYHAGSYKYSELQHNPENITGGYLLEYELAIRYPDEASGFVSDYGQPIVIKSPEFASKEQVEYISDYYQQFENAVLNVDGINSLGKHYSEYLDVESMAKMYVLQELVKNLDAGITSFYLYKEVDGKLVAAPVWDFDSSLGRKFTRFDKNLENPLGMWATELPMDFVEDDKRSILALLCSHPEFRQVAAEQWETVFAPLMDKFVSSAETLMAEIVDSAIVDKTRWNQESVENDLVKVDSSTITEWVEQSSETLLSFIELRSGYLDELFNTDNCYIQYYSVEEKSLMHDYKFYSKGQSAIVRYCDFESPDDTYRFDGWNTEPDGSGKQYFPEDTIVMDQTVRLYAQWTKKGLVTRILEWLKGLFNS